MRTLALVVGLSACSNGGHGHATATTTTPTTASGSVTTTTVVATTAAQLATGRWSTIPAAPLTPRVDAALAWTGQELIVWGGEFQPKGVIHPVVEGDGAAFNPISGRWRRLPPAPLSGRAGAVAVWTGSELIVLGGSDARQLSGYNSQNLVAGPRDAAAYKPATNTWQSIRAMPLNLQPGALGVWSGDRVVVLSGLNSAAYDPATGMWQRLPPADAPANLPGYKVDENGWSLAVATGTGRIFAWAVWAATKQISAQESQGTGGSDLFRYDESSHRWTVLTGWANAIREPQEAFWTGTRLLVRGDQHIPGALGPGPLPEVSRWYNPTTGTTTRLPPDALTADHVPASQLSSAWTGDALWSLNAMGQTYRIKPGDASAYDATHYAWRRLRSAPFGCAMPVTPAWTGKSVLIYCPTPYPAQPNTIGGLEYTVR